MENIGDLMKNVMSETTKKDREKSISYDKGFLLDEMKAFVGDADWTKSHKNFEKLLSQYETQNKLIEMKETIADCKSKKKIPKNHGAYLTRALLNGLDPQETKDKAKSNGKKIINVNFAEVNPGWALERKVKGKRTVVIDNESGHYQVTIQNAKDNINPVKKTMQLNSEIEQIYSDFNCPGECIIEIGAAELLKRLDWPASGQSNDDLKEHLDILTNTQVHSDGVYKYKDKGIIKEIPRTTVFNLINGYDFFDEKDVTKPIKKIKISLSPFLAQNVREKYFLLKDKPKEKLSGAVDLFLYEFLLKRKGTDCDHTCMLSINEVADLIGIYTKEAYERKRNIKEALESFKIKNLIKSYSINENTLHFQVFF